MFLSRLFKHARTKALVVLAGLSMTLGVGATIFTVAATQQNEVVETKATSNWTYYCAVNLSGGATSMQVQYKLSHPGSWTSKAMTSTGKTYNGAPIYSVSFSDSYDGLGGLQFQQMNGSTAVSTHNIWDSEWRGSSASEASNGKMHVWAKDSYNMTDYMRDVTVYYSISESSRNGYTVKINAKEQGSEVPDGSATWHSAAMTDSGYVYNGNPIWSNRFAPPYGGVSKIQFQLWNGGSFVSQEEWNPGTWKYCDDIDGKLFYKDGTLKSTDFTYDDLSGTTTSYYFDVSAMTSTDFIDAPNKVRVRAFISANVYQDYAYASSQITKIEQTGTGSASGIKLVAYSVTVPDNAKLVLYASTASGTFTIQTTDIDAPSLTGNLINVSKTQSAGKYTWSDSGVTTDGTVKTVTLKKIVNGATTDVGVYPLLTGETFNFRSDQCPAVTGYTPAANWYTGTDGTSGTPYPASNGTYTANSNLTVYNLYTVNYYTITYSYVVDGVDQTQITDGTVSVAYGTLYGNISPEPTLYGCSFDGWYSDAACKNGISGNAVTGAADVFAKFTSDKTGYDLYFALSNTYAGNMTIDSGTYTFVQCFNKNVEPMAASTIKVKELTGISILGWKHYCFHVPADTTDFLIYNGTYGVDTQTEDMHIGTNADTALYNNGHNLFVLDTNDRGDNGRRVGSWVDIKYYLEVASDTGFTSNLSTYSMTPPNDPSSGNSADILGITVPVNYYVRGHYVVKGGEGFNITVGGAESTGDSTKWKYVAQQDGVGAKIAPNNGGASFANKKLNVYIAGDGKMWFIDCGGIDAGGYLYISTDLSPANIKLDCAQGSYSHAKLSTVSGIESDANTMFDGVLGLIKVPVYELHRGTQAVKTALSVTLTSASDSSKTTSVTGLTVRTDKQDFIITLDSTDTWGASTAVATTNVAAASTALRIGSAISNAISASVCNVDEDTAKALCDLYDVAATKTLFENNLSTYGIQSWDGSNTVTRGTPVYEGSAFSSFKNVRYELGQIAGGTYKVASPYTLGRVPSAAEQSPLTLTLWIVLGAGVLGLGAIGTAYFVSKKKKRPTA